MAVTVFASGTKTAEIGVEHFLSSPNVAGTFMLIVDLNKMAAGDSVELRAYRTALEGGTARVMYFHRRDGVQVADDMMAVSVPVSTGLAVTNAIRFSLKQVNGTGREFPWTVEKFA